MIHTHHGQLRSLKDRMTPRQLDRRVHRIATKRLVLVQLEDLRLQYAKAVGIANFQHTILSRPFFGRLKFAFFKR